MKNRDFSDYRLVDIMDEAIRNLSHMVFESTDDAFNALMAEVRRLLDEEWGLFNGFL